MAVLHSTSSSGRRRQLYIDVIILSRIKKVYPIYYDISLWCVKIGNFFVRLSVGRTFLFLGKLLGSLKSLVNMRKQGGVPFRGPAFLFLDL